MTWPIDNNCRVGSTFHFVTEGFSSALERAHEAATGRDVLLPRGRKLFDDLNSDMITLEQTRVVEGRGVTHLKYRVQGPD